MRGLKAVVFDLDDTLYPERDYVLSAFGAVAEWIEAQLGIPHDKAFAELQALFQAGVRGKTFDHWLSMHGFSIQPAVSQMVRVYRKHRPTLVVPKETLEVLKWLRPRYRVGLLSDGHLSVQRQKLAALGIESCFDAVVFSDEFGAEHRKPSPRPFRLALRRLRVKAHETVYVADNPGKDFLGAKKVGIRTVRVRAPGSLYSTLEAPSPGHAPGAEVRRLRDLKGLLRQ